MYMLKYYRGLDMKKMILIILSIFLAIIVGIYMNYKEAMISQNEAQKFNLDFEFYNKKELLGTDITTIINKAVDNNEKYNVPKDENGLYIPNHENSIKIYVHMIINETTYPMEALNKTGLKEFTRYFGEVKFKCSDVKYHSKTGKISEMTFEAIEE